MVYLKCYINKNTLNELYNHVFLILYIKKQQRNTEEPYQSTALIPHWTEMAAVSVLVQKRTQQCTSADFYEFLKLDFLRPPGSEKKKHLKLWLESSFLKILCLYWRIKQKDVGIYRPVRRNWFQTKKMKPCFTVLRIKP